VDKKLVKKYFFLDELLSTYNLKIASSKELLEEEISRIMIELSRKKMVEVKNCNKDELELLNGMLKSKLEDFKLFHFAILIISISLTIFSPILPSDNVCSRFFLFIFIGLIIIVTNLFLAKKITSYTLLIELIDFYTKKYK
jgi:hypothetical protein